MNGKFYVIYSNEFETPNIVTELHEDLFYSMQEEDSAENFNNARYAHYYESVEDDYGITEYHFITTKNAPKWR